MQEKRIQELIFRYNAQHATTNDLLEIEKLIESGKIDLQSLEQIAQVEVQLEKVKFPAPSGALTDRFYQMLALEQRRGISFSWKTLFSRAEAVPKFAFAAMILLIGIILGFFLRYSSASDNEIKALSQQVTDLKEMMMLTLLEQESATERLKAVNLTHEMSDISNTITIALLKTLKYDNNVNVRLAALEALCPYVVDSNVRQELVKSIAKQESPLVQIALAEVMIEIQEKSSVKELERILHSERTPVEVKRKIQEGIKILI
jgi:hypothetical protein